MTEDLKYMAPQISFNCLLFFSPAVMHILMVCILHVYTQEPHTVGKQMCASILKFYQ